MKISVSLPDEDVAYVDRVAASDPVPNRSAVLHRAIEALRDRELEAEYAAADEEWINSGDAVAWDAVAGDGIA